MNWPQEYWFLRQSMAPAFRRLADSSKADDEVDELERLRRENLRLKRQLEEKDMVVELLKKVKEFERMWGLEKYAMNQNI